MLNLNITSNDYNNFILKLFFTHKIKLIILIIIGFLGYKSLPYLNKLSLHNERRMKYGEQLLDIDDIENKIKDFDYIIDVRSPEEYKLGHLKNSINIEYYDFDEDVINSYNITKDKTIFIYCNSGRRSSIVLDKLINDYDYDLKNLYTTNLNYKQINEVL